MFAMTGVLRPMSSRSSKVKFTPARRAMAMRWIIALVEQPVAIATVTALRVLACVMILSGVRSSQTISTMRRPHAADMRL